MNPIIRKRLRQNRKTVGSIASYPAMPLTQNEQTFYLATIPVEDIFPYCFVSRREENPIEGFQRNLSEARAKDIARYLDNSMGSIPTNIVLSAQPEVEFEYSSSNKTMKFKRLEKGFLIIDGQHRMYGYGQTKKQHRVPVAIYVKLNRRAESALFIDINTNQRGVPASLLLDIKHIAQRESEIEIKLRELFDKLNKDAESPFCGLLSPLKPRVGKIAKVTFNKSMHQVIENELINKLPDEKQYQLILNYFKALESVLSNKENSRLLVKSVYFDSFCALFEDVLTEAYAKHHNYKYSSLHDVLEPLGNYDFTAMHAGGRVKMSKSTILPTLRKIIKTQTAITADMI